MVFQKLMLVSKVILFPDPLHWEQHGKKRSRGRGRLAPVATEVATAKAIRRLATAASPTQTTGARHLDDATTPNVLAPERYQICALSTDPAQHYHHTAGPGSVAFVLPVSVGIMLVARS